MASSLLIGMKTRQAALRGAEIDQPSFTEALQAIRAFFGINPGPLVDITPFV
jgi:hypothetical protein